MKKWVSLLVLSLLVVPSLTLASFDQNVKYGTKNSEAVREVQEFLTDQEVYTGPITGNFYALTLKAVKKFQSVQGLKVTGFWGQSERDRANQLTDLSESNQIPDATAPSMGFLDGSYFDSAGNPVKFGGALPVIVVTPTTTPTVTDVCTNIEGTQTAVPMGMVYDNGQCVTPVASQPVTQTPSYSAPAQTPTLLPPYSEYELARLFGCSGGSLPQPSFENASSTAFSLNYSCSTGGDFLPINQRTTLTFNGNVVCQNGNCTTPYGTRTYFAIDNLSSNTTYSYTITYTESGRQDTVVTKSFTTK